MLDERITLQTTGELAEWYDDKYREMGGTWHTPDDTWQEHLKLMGIPLDPLANSGKLLMDVGCGDGSFVKYVSQYIAAQGIEISRRAIEYARQKFDGLGFNIYYGNAETGFGYRSYDYITYMGSLEHVIAIDKALDNTYNALKIDGVLYVFAPNEKYVHVDQCNDRRGTDEAWSVLFERHEFKVERSERMNDSTAFVMVKI